MAGGAMAPVGKGEDLNHHALEQLPGLAYCINDNPRWREFSRLNFVLFRIRLI